MDKIKEAINWCERKESIYNIPNGGDQNVIAYGCFSAMKQYLLSLQSESEGVKSAEEIFKKHLGGNRFPDYLRKSILSAIEESLPKPPIK